MARTTTTLGMELPVPTTLEPFSTARTNANFLVLEAGILSDRGRLSTLEALGVVRAGPTGRADFEVTNLTQLDAISTAVVGDTCTVLDPGAGNAGSTFIDPIVYTAVAGSGVTIDWRVTSIVIADTKAHFDTFIAAQAALIADIYFQVGGTWFVSNVMVSGRFTTNAGAYKATPGQIKPSAAPAGTGVTMDAAGTITMLNTPKLEVTQAFNDFFSVFKIIEDITGRSGTGDFFYRLGVAAGLVSTGYTNARRYNLGTGAITVDGSAIATYAVGEAGGVAGSRVYSETIIKAPNQARATAFTGTHTAGNGPYRADTSGEQTNPTAYTDFTIDFNNTITRSGTVMIFGVA